MGEKTEPNALGCDEHFGFSGSDSYRIWGCVGRAGAPGTNEKRQRHPYSPRKIVSAGSSEHKKSDIFIVLLVDSSEEKDSI